MRHFRRLQEFMLLHPCWLTGVSKNSFPPWRGKVGMGEKIRRGGGNTSVQHSPTGEGRVRQADLRKVVMARGLGVVLVILPMLVSGMAGEGGAEIYTWVDRDGQVHFTDDYSSVPPAYRDRVQSHPSSPPSETLLPPAPSATPKKDKSTKAPSSHLTAMGGQAKVVAVLDGDTIVI